MDRPAGGVFIFLGVVHPLVLRVLQVLCRKRVPATFYMGLVLLQTLWVCALLCWAIYGLSRRCALWARVFAARHGLQASMSRKGNSWDNAVMERSFLNLKMERVWQRDYANHAEAIRDVTDYIVGFYNSTRLHSKRGYLPPTVYEREMADKQPIDVSEIT